jgi:ligand-binding SRPBCC domain-containing protein
VPRFEVSSIVPAAPDAVWERVTAPVGINDELRPLLRMTVPAPMRGRGIGDVAPGQHLGRSCLLLFGVLPVEYDDITIAELEPGQRFLERSSMLSMSRWEHERVITPAGRSCSVRDAVTFELRRPLARVPGLECLVRSGLTRLFRHRHTRLGRHFGSVRPGRP